MGAPMMPRAPAQNWSAVSNTLVARSVVAMMPLPVLYAGSGLNEPSFSARKSASIPASGAPALVAPRHESVTGGGTEANMSRVAATRSCWPACWISVAPKLAAGVLVAADATLVVARRGERGGGRGGADGHASSVGRLARALRRGTPAFRCCSDPTTRQTPLGRNARSNRPGTAAMRRTASRSRRTARPASQPVGTATGAAACAPRSGSYRHCCSCTRGTPRRCSPIRGSCPGRAALRGRW